jgi:PAS domain S-box-containing protein
VGPDHEIPHLRERLEEAEAVCRALQDGKVDAVVVGRSDEERRVLLLSDAYLGYRRMVEDMPHGGLTLLPSGEILYANRAFRDLLGRDDGALAHSRLESHVVADCRPRLRRLLASSPGGDEAEIDLVRANGEGARARMVLVGASEDFLTVLAMPVTAESEEQSEVRAMVRAIRDGRVDGIVVGGQRVALIDGAHTPYRALVERMRQGAATVSRDGTIVFANQSLAATIGLPASRLLGLPVTDLVDERDRLGLLELLAGPDSGQRELRLRGSDGGRPHALCAVSMIDDHRLLLFSDVTDRKRFAASDERTRRFLGYLACELADLLASIDASVTQVRRARLDAAGRAALDAIERSAGRMNALVGELRDVNPAD